MLHLFRCLAAHHRASVLLGDIKPGNMFVNFPGLPVFGDYGHATVFDQSGSRPVHFSRIKPDASARGRLEYGELAVDRLSTAMAEIVNGIPYSSTAGPPLRLVVTCSSVGTAPYRAVETLPNVAGIYTERSDWHSLAVSLIELFAGYSCYVDAGPQGKGQHAEVRTGFRLERLLSQCRRLEEFSLSVPPCTKKEWHDRGALARVPVPLIQLLRQLIEPARPRGAAWRARQQRLCLGHPKGRAARPRSVPHSPSSLPPSPPACCSGSHHRSLPLAAHRPAPPRRRPSIPPWPLPPRLRLRLRRRRPRTRLPSPSRRSRRSRNASCSSNTTGKQWRTHIGASPWNAGCKAYPPPAGPKSGADAQASAAGPTAAAAILLSLRPSQRPISVLSILSLSHSSPFSLLSPCVLPLCVHFGRTPQIAPAHRRHRPLRRPPRAHPSRHVSAATSAPQKRDRSSSPAMGQN